MKSTNRWHAGRVAVAAALVVTAAALGRAEAGSPGAADQTWSVVHTRGAGSATEIYVTNRDGTSERLTRNRVYDGQPAWSPTRDLAFVRDTAGGDIYTMTADGKRAKRLTRHPSRDNYPAWSPDGRLIAFASNRHGEGEIYVMRSDGTGLRRLTRTARHVDDTQPRFTKDGKNLVFSSNRVSFFNYELYRIRVSDGKGLKRLTFWGSGQDGAPGDDLMPDVLAAPREADRIAFVSDRAGGYAVWTMAADGRDLREVARHAGSTTAFPRFSPDGKRLVYMTFDANGSTAGSHLWTVNVDGTNRKPLGKGGEPDW